MAAREEWLTLREACSIVGVSPATLRRWSDNGDIVTYTTPGGHRRFARSAILGLLPAPAPGNGPLAASGNGDDPALSRLLALTTHGRRVPSLAREAFAAELDAVGLDDASIVLHTCHRVELYLIRDHGSERRLPQPPPGARRLEGVDAARHLIAVACGLDSAVLGENQVLHQVRETVKQRRGEQRLDPTLDRLFGVALNAGRRARSWLSGTRLSLADVALDRMARRVGAPEGRDVLVVGAGVMGRLAAFAAARRGANVIVTSRTPARALALAREVNGGTIPFEADDVLPPVDGVLVALMGSWPIGNRDALRLADAGAIVVDMSSPPAVPGPLQRRLEDRFISTDDLAGESGFEPQGRLRRRLDELVAESTDSFCRWLHSRNALPAIQAIGEAADEQRRDQLAWLFRRLPDLCASERSLIEQMSHRLVADILHAPRSALNSDESGELSRAALELFSR